MMEKQKYANRIVQFLVKKGFVAYFAGGWVRDYLLGHPSDDIDIATNAPPEKILNIFPGTNLVGLAFGVVIVNMEGHQFEVSTFRRDVNYTDGRKPERIELSTAEEDAKRRDFTINGMFYDPLEDTIYDFVNGKSDLAQGIIRAIGNPSERFYEDRLRMIRAIRFASRFGFHIDAETQDGIIENAPSLFPSVAMERIWQEFNKMTPYANVDRAIIEMHRLGLLQVIFPDLVDVHLTEIKHRVSGFPHFPQNCPTIYYIAELFPDASPEQLLEICKYLRTGNQDARRLEMQYQARSLLSREKDNGVHFDPISWTHFFAHPESQVILDVHVAKMAPDSKQAALRKYLERRVSLLPHIERIELKKPLVTAANLQSLGIPQGKQLGLLLKEAEKIAISKNMNSAQEVIEHLKKSSLWPKQ